MKQALQLDHASIQQHGTCKSGKLLFTEYSKISNAKHNYQAIFSGVVFLVRPHGSNSGYSISLPTRPTAAPSSFIDNELAEKYFKNYRFGWITSSLIVNLDRAVRPVGEKALATAITATTTTTTLNISNASQCLEIALIRV